MAAVIGFVSLILIIVAVITSATLGQSLEGRLHDQARSIADETTVLVTQQAFRSAVTGDPLTARTALAGAHFQVSGLLLAIFPSSGETGVALAPDGTTDLTDAQLLQLKEAVKSSPGASVTLDGLGSFQLTVTKSNGIGIVTGLPAMTSRAPWRSCSR